MVREEDTGLVVKFYLPFIIWPPGQRIGGIGFTRSMCEFEMVFLEELFPSGLSMREVLRFAEIGEVLVVSKDFKWMGSTRAVNRTVYGYGRIPYGEYTGTGCTIL